MGYYRGDGSNYYRGDYYRGDPFLGALVGGAVGKLAGRAAAWVGKKIGGGTGRAVGRTLRDAAPGVVGGALGYGIGSGGVTLPGGSLPALGPIGMIPAGPTKGSASGALDRMKGRIAGGKMRRTMNPLNPKALRRALRRAEGFEKFAKRTVNAMYKTVDGRRVKTFKKTTRRSR